MLGILRESSVQQTIHTNCKSLFSPKNKSKCFELPPAAALTGVLRVNFSIVDTGFNKTWSSQHSPTQGKCVSEKLDRKIKF